MKLLKWLYYEPKHDNGDFVTEMALKRSVVSSIIGILICMACLFGLTWAWYTSSTLTGPNQISTATFDLDVVVKASDEGSVNKETDGYYHLDPTKTYTITLTKNGTATKGFCQLGIKRTDGDSDTAYYTKTIPHIVKEGGSDVEKPFVFTVLGVAKIKFTAMWGECTKTQNIVDYNGQIYFEVPSVSTPSPKPSAQTAANETEISEETAQSSNKEQATDTSESTTENAD